MKRGFPPARQQPLTVIGGFLGAGKTTLINRILSEARGRYAVLVNDFGAVNVDAGLIARHDGETLELTNGCICCSIADGFVGTLLKVLGAAEPFDHIIVEASGVSDPWLIAEIAMVEPDLTLNGVFVLADAERLAAHIADPRLSDIVTTQLRGADIIILTKVDLTGPASLAEAREVIARLSPGRPSVEVRGERVLPLSLLLPDHVVRRPLQPRAIAIADHEAQFCRIGYRHEGSISREALAKALNEAPASLLRLKGTLAVTDMAQAQLLQMVGRRWSLTPLPGDAASGAELTGIALADAAAERHLSDLLDMAFASNPFLPSAIPCDTRPNPET